MVSTVIRLKIKQSGNTVPAIALPQVALNAKAAEDLADHYFKDNGDYPTIAR